MPHNRFDPHEGRHEDLIAAINAAARLISHTIKEGLNHMADRQAQALADLNTALNAIADAIAAEIAALQSAIEAGSQPDDSGQIEASVSRLNDLTSALKKSIPVAAPTVPTITGLSPASGPAAGGTSVTLTGTGLTGSTGLTVGGTSVTDLNITSDSSATFTTPPGTGSAAVVVTTPGGSSDGSTAFSFI